MQKEDRQMLKHQVSLPYMHHKYSMGLKVMSASQNPQSLEKDFLGKILMY